VRNAKSSFDRIRGHLLASGCSEPVPPGMRDDLIMVLRRCEQADERAGEYGGVELSPYMKTLLRVSVEATRASTPVRTQAVASV
jgi:hypothetical protein